MLRAVNAQIGFRTRGQSRTLFTLDTELSPGLVTAVVGANGAGKTTLLRTIAGFAEPVAGTIVLDDMSPATYRTHHGIGVLPEKFLLPRNQTGREFLLRVAAAAVCARRLELVRQWPGVTEAIELAGIDFELDMHISELSNGMKQRLALGAALIPVPEVLLLDEPETGLDPAQRTRLRASLASLAARGVTVIVSSHDVTGLCLIAHQLWLISDELVTTIALRDIASLDELFARLPAGWQQ